MNADLDRELAEQKRQAMDDILPDDEEPTDERMRMGKGMDRNRNVNRGMDKGMDMGKGMGERKPDLGYPPSSSDKAREKPHGNE